MRKTDYQLIRSKRRTIAICIGRDGSVTVRAPHRTALNTIERFVSEKENWIQEKSTQMSEQEADRKRFCVSPGSQLPLLGKNYSVELGSGVAFDGTRFFVPDQDYTVFRPKLEQLYKNLARQIIEQRVQHYSKLTGWVPEGVRIGSAKTSWGSCSGQNKLNFTWRLVLAAPEQIDYVVVHELAHLKEHNHSARFWKLVEGIFPDYLSRRARLKKLGENLQKFNLG